MTRFRQLTLFDDDLPRRGQSIKKGTTVAATLNDYEGFLEKFEAKRTTDDCYTPREIYDAVLGWLRAEGYVEEWQQVLRPFYPGGDYQSESYPPGSVVVDNPPFSIYAQIVHWYIANGVPFFLFGPQLTLVVSNCDVCYLPINANITYANGAKVATGFVTNLIKGVRLWTCPSLRKAIDDVTPPPTIIPQNTYPDNLITTATMGKIATRYVDLKIASGDCYEVGNVTALAAKKKGLFGRGFLLADRAAADRAAADRAAADRAAGTTIQLSEEEQKIIETLNNNYK